MFDFNTYNYILLGVTVSLTGAVVFIVRKLIRRRLQHTPQSLNIKVTRVQKQDRQEKKKKEDDKFKQVEYLFDTKNYVKLLQENQVIQICSDQQQRAARILFLEVESILENPVDGIGLLPRENNLFEWHANIRPLTGAGTKGVFHYIINIPSTYPDAAPQITQSTPLSYSYLLVQTVTYPNWTKGLTLIDIMKDIQLLLTQAATEVHATNSLLETNTKIHHNADHPWPPVPKTSSILGSVIGKVETYEDKMKKELICFYTKQNFERTQLGLGINFSKNLRNGEIQSIHCSTKLVSIKAFNRYKIRNIDGLNYSHWLPVYINSTHAPMNLAERAISLICTETSDAFNPDMILLVLPKLMNTIIVDTMTNKLTEKAGLRLFCFVHRLLLAFEKKYPEISEKATTIIKGFIRDDAKRHKNETPNLGDLLALLPVTNIRWDDLKEAFYTESSARNVLHILKAYPKLDPEYKEKKARERQARIDEGEAVSDDESDDEELSDEDRILQSFAATRTGKQIMVFQVFFLNNIAQPQGFTREQIAKQYDDFYGLPVDNIEQAYLQEFSFIRSMNSDDFLSAIGIPLVSDTKLAIQLVNDIIRSKQKGYHGNSLAVVTRPEDFAKQNRIDLKKFGTLNDKNQIVFHTDDDKWAQAVQTRWGIDTIPEYCNSWKETYLSNHIRDTVENLNESQDFDYVYEVIESCETDVTYLELELFDPTNLKSKYFYLSKILGKLKQLETLKLVRGEVSFTDKAFKALCMGLNRNKSIRSLILENCGITGTSLESLLSQDLVGGNITLLVLSGNTLGDAGAIKLANFLAHHTSLPHLQELQLNGCRIGDSGGNAIAEALVFKTELRVLELKNNDITSSMSTILNKVAYCPKIEQVNFTNNRGSITSQAMDQISFITGSLRSLKLWKIGGFDISTPKAIESLSNNQTLIELDLGCCGYVSNMISFGKILAQNKTLKTLCLQSTKITAATLVTLYDAVTENGGIIHLERLDLSKNQLFTVTNAIENHKYSKREIAEFDVIGNLLLCAKNLMSIDLTECSLHMNSVKKIGEALAENTPLESLILKKNKLGKSIQYLANGLKKNTHLKELDVSGNELGASGALDVADLLKTNVTLKKLSIYGNFIEPDGCVSIVDALQANVHTNLRDLDLGVNRIKARGIKSIIEWIKKDLQFPLTHIALKDDHINDTLALNLVNSICKNRANNKIQSIALYGNPLRITTVNQIATELAQSGIKFDLAKQVEVKQEERQQRTVYIPALSFNMTKEQVKRLFYKNNCGKIVNIEMHNYKKRGTAGAAKYAFVEFVDADSVNIAMSLPANKKNKIGTCQINIYRAGITQKKQQQ
jgi:Ran GTPase-activating protein (RanGAP) involved in mRNA processing and transport/ubiquitin-protein ligase